MTQDQTRYLKQRLNEIRQRKPSRYSPIALPTPANVKAAKALEEKAAKVTKSWNKRLDKARESRTRRIDKANDACYRAILFGEAKAALKALDRFEAMKF